MRPDDPHWQLQLTTEVPTVNRLGRKRVLSNLSLQVLRASEQRAKSDAPSSLPRKNNTVSRLRSVAAGEVAANASLDIVAAPDVNLIGAIEKRAVAVAHRVRVHPDWSLNAFQRWRPLPNHLPFSFS